MWGINLIFFESVYIFSAWQELIVRSNLNIVENSFTHKIVENTRQFFQGYTLGVKRLYIFIFEGFVLIFAVIRYRKHKVLSSLALIAITTFLFSLCFLMPFRTRYMRSIVMIVLFLSLAVMIKEKGRLQKGIILLYVLYLFNHMIGDFLCLLSTST